MWGETAQPGHRVPCGATRYVRIGGDTRDAEDRFYPLKNGTILAEFSNGRPDWAEADQNGETGALAGRKPEDHMAERSHFSLGANLSKDS